MLRRVVRWKLTDVSEEHGASIFGVEKEANQETSVKEEANYKKGKLCIEVKWCEVKGRERKGREVNCG
jgi:hypothetical protein